MSLFFFAAEVDDSPTSSCSLQEWRKGLISDDGMFWTLGDLLAALLSVDVQCFSLNLHFSQSIDVPMCISPALADLCLPFPSRFGTSRQCCSMIFHWFHLWLFHCHFLSSNLPARQLARRCQQVSFPTKLQSGIASKLEHARTSGLFLRLLLFMLLPSEVLLGLPLRFFIHRQPGRCLQGCFFVCRFCENRKCMQETKSVCPASFSSSITYLRAIAVSMHFLLVGKPPRCRAAVFLIVHHAAPSSRSASPHQRTASTLSLLFSRPCHSSFSSSACLSLRCKMFYVTTSCLLPNCAIDAAPKFHWSPR